MPKWAEPLSLESTRVTPKIMSYLGNSKKKIFFSQTKHNTELQFHKFLLNGTKCKAMFWASLSRTYRIVGQPPGNQWARWFRALVPNGPGFLGLRGFPGRGTCSAKTDEAPGKPGWDGHPTYQDNFSSRLTSMILIPNFCCIVITCDV